MASTLAGVSRVGAESTTSASPARELIRDPRFQTGFQLIEPAPGKRVIYGRLSARGAALLAWDLDQWSSRFPLSPTPLSVTPQVGTWGNPGKQVTLAVPPASEADLVLEVKAITEYSGKARKSSEPWVHLLAEQSFANPPSIAALRSARLWLEARLLKSELLRTADYSPGLHAAQFQMFLMIQNRNRQSRGFGKLLWFGIPIYDDRSRFPQAFKARDFGGTGMFIFTPGGEVFSSRSAHDRQWIRIDKELLPLFHEALEAAWQGGFLLESRQVADYFLTGMNLGWEVPGLFDVAMQVRGLSLRVKSE